MGKVRRSIKVQVDMEGETGIPGTVDRPPVALSQPGSTPVVGVKVPSGSLTASSARDGSAGASFDASQEMEVVWEAIRQLQGRVEKIECAYNPKESKLEEESGEMERETDKGLAVPEATSVALGGQVKTGATGMINLSKPLLPLGVEHVGDKTPRVCTVHVRGEEIERWRQKTGGQQIRFELHKALTSRGVETGPDPLYQKPDGSCGWQLRWTPIWDKDQLVTWGRFTRLVGAFQGPVADKERAVIVRAQLRDGWKKEEGMAEQD